MIPKIIWQTYKDPFDQLQPYMIEAINTWKNLNPNYEYYYMDDQQAADFVLKEYGQEWYDIFINLPIGVMRGDVWRYMVIYKYGGVYTDLDTECLKPISNWMNEDHEMIVCPENNIHFCQWTFAASAGNPVLKAVLDLVKERLLNPVYEGSHFVHGHTGPGVWTEAIMNFLNIKSINISDDYLLINSSDNAKIYKFHCYGGKYWRVFHNIDVRHIYGSQRWNDGSYTQWIKDPLLKGTE